MSLSIDSAVAEKGNDTQEYGDFQARMSANIARAVGEGHTLFATNVENLYEVYLSGFEPHRRQYHNCHTCKRFIERFGGLVTINEDGRLSPVVWENIDPEDEAIPAIEAMKKEIRRAKVLYPFYSSEKHWGQAHTGIWRHFAMANPNVFKSLVKSDYEMMMGKLQDFETVSNALTIYTKDIADEALRVVKSDLLPRSEKVLGPAEWLVEVQTALQRPHIHRPNVLWRFVAKAPDGFCHLKSSMIGTLLDDISSGMKFEDVAKRFAAKMNPLLYQRPQAAPAAGTILRAEKLVEQMGIERSFWRRQAMVSEIETIWRPKPLEPEVKPGGLFGDLLPNAKEQNKVELSMPTQTMTWEKFQRTVLPEAESIEILIPHGINSFCSLMTALHADAPPILQWDSEERRNPFSWYFYGHGSEARQWNLFAGRWVSVPAITLMPHMWHQPEKFKNQGRGVMFVIEGARDQSLPSMALFPETLKSALHEVRSVVEAFSNKHKVTEVKEPIAAGIMKKDDPSLNMRMPDWGTQLRVKSKGKTATYKLDRWD